MTAVFTGDWGVLIPLQFQTHDKSEEGYENNVFRCNQPILSGTRAKTLSPRRAVRGGSVLSRHRAQRTKAKEFLASTPAPSAMNATPISISTSNKDADGNAQPDTSNAIGRAVRRVARPTSINTELGRKQSQPQLAVATHQPESQSHSSLESSPKVTFVQPFDDGHPSLVSAVERKKQPSIVLAADTTKTWTLRRIVGLRRLRAAVSPSRFDATTKRKAAMPRLPLILQSEQPDDKKDIDRSTEIFASTRGTLEQWNFTTRPEIDERYVFHDNQGASVC